VWTEFHIPSSFCKNCQRTNFSYSHPSNTINSIN